MNDWLLLSAFLVVVLAVTFTLWRLVKGPHPVDRIICLDLIGISIAGLVSIQAIRSNQLVLLDTVLVLSIILFIGTILFARYIEGYIEKKEQK